MALAPHPRSPKQPDHEGFQSEFLRLYGAICAVASVGLVGVAASHGQIDLWVRLAEDDEEQEERIYRHLQQYRASSSLVPVDLHVVTPDESDGAFPSTVDVVYTRA